MAEETTTRVMLSVEIVSVIEDGKRKVKSLTPSIEGTSDITVREGLRIIDVARHTPFEALEQDDLLDTYLAEGEGDDVDVVNIRPTKDN